MDSDIPNTKESDQMEMKAGLTFACMNLKKLARILAQREVKSTLISDIWCETKEKWLLSKSGAGVVLQHQLCLQSEAYWGTPIDDNAA